MTFKFMGNSMTNYVDFRTHRPTQNFIRNEEFLKKIGNPRIQKRPHITLNDL